MSKKRFSAEQIVVVLRQIEVLQSQGKSPPVACREAAGFLGMSVEILERVYGHHHPNHLKKAAHSIGYPRDLIVKGEGAPHMRFDDVILGRRSIRGYKPDEVPRALIEEIIGLAMRAPSSMNTQPWNFYVITGEPLNRIRAGNTARMVAGVPQSREFRTNQGFTGQHRDRQVGVAKQLFSAMGIDRDDKDKRQDWVLRGFRQFDAPVCVIVTYDRVLDGSDDTPFDCGAVATALVNAAWSRGLGAVINSQGIMQSPVVREHAGIADDQVIMKSIALGWPDESFPANAVVSERKSVDEATVFVGFEN